MYIERVEGSFLKKWWYSIDKYSLFSIISLIVFGFIVLMAASPSRAERLGEEPFYFVYRQAVFLLLGLILLFFTSFFSKKINIALCILGFFICVFLLVAVKLFGSEINGSKRWVYIAGFSLQPSEFIKPFFTVMVAWILSMNNHLSKLKKISITSIFYLIIVVLLIIQPDFGMTIMVSLIWGTQIFLYGLPFLLIICLVILAIVGIAFAYIHLPHVKGRIDRFIDPTGGDYHQNQKSMEAFQNGGFFGTGPGEGVVKNSLPDSHTDFIFAVAGEELGTIFCIIIISIYAFFIVREFLKTINSRNLFVTLTVSGLLIQFAIQAIINMSVSLNLVPNTGMTLPFISYGGSSTLALSIAIGLILSFNKRA